MQPEPHEPERPTRFDGIACDLQKLKDSQQVSYAELVRRITQLRVARGVDPVVAPPARSTVYDAFREGRVRVDPHLVRDIVCALGVPDAEADCWVDRCRDAQRPLPAEIPDTFIQDDRPGLRSDQEQAHTALSQAKRHSVPRTGAVLHGVYPRGFLVPFLLGCLILNFAGDVTVRALGLPLYLDMIGTAVAAISLGPWWGVAIAVVSNLASLPLAQGHTPLFALVAIAGALTWGYGVRKFNMGQDFLRYFLLGVIAAVVCSIVAVPILVLLFGGGNGHAGDLIWQRFTDAGIPLVLAVFLSNITTSVIDKLLSSFIALAVFTALYSRFGIPAEHLPLVQKLGSDSPAGGIRAAVAHSGSPCSPWAVNW